MHVFEGNLKPIDPEFLKAMNRSSFKEQVCQLGIVLSIASGFAIPVSTSLTSLFTIGIVVCWLVSEQYKISIELLKKYRVASVSLLLFGFLSLGLFYTPETFSLAARNLFKYRQFLLIPIYLSFFAELKSRQRAIQMFELAMIVTLVGSMIYAIIPIDTDDQNILACSVFKNRITQNILMAFFVYLATWKFLEKPKKRWPYAVLALVATINVIAVVPGRSGYLALIVLIFLLMYQKLGFKGIVPALLCIGGIGVLAYAQSEKFHNRINLVINEIREYQTTQVRNSGVNLRLEFYENGLHLAKSKPLIGYGIGSFGLKYHELMQEKGQLSTSNPHSEYVMLLVQNGAIGVCLFLTFFWVSCRATRFMSGEDRVFGQAVLAVYLIGCMVNSLMLDTTEGTLFGFLVGVSFAGGAFSIEEKEESNAVESPTQTENSPEVRDAA